VTTRFDKRFGFLGRMPIAILITLVLAAVATACGSGGSTSSDKNTVASSRTTVRMALNPATSGLPVYVAHDLGMFKDNGLDVKISSVTDISVLPLALGHQYDFGMSVQPILLSAIARGIPLVVTAGGQYETEQSPNGLVVASQASGITKAADLAGKTVGVVVISGNLTDCLLSWAKESGVDPESIKLRQVPLANMADTLKANKVDAVVSIPPFSDVILNGPNVKLGQPCLSISPTSQGTFLVSNKSWASAHTDVVAKVQKSMSQAITWIGQNPDQAKKVLAKYTGLPAEVVANLKLPAYNASLPASDLQAWINALQDLGKLTGPVPDANDLVVTPGS
jgi:NitT/TauT family transport system substrate-binding protein